MTILKKLLIRYIFLFVVVVLFFSAKNVYSMDICYEDQYYPHATKLHETSKGIEVCLGGIYIEDREGRKADIIIPRIMWQRNNNWKYMENSKNNICEVDHYPRPESCSIKIPDWPKVLPREFCKGSENAREYKFCLEYASNDEQVSSCALTKDAAWFGINFYQGEGSYGYGGLGRYDRQNNTVDVRKIPELKDYPIHKVAWDGKHIWAATTNNWECYGHPPALGLVKYDWEKNKLTVFGGTEAGPCGFIVNDLFWSQGFLWVATDVGISRWDSVQNKWTHYLPDIKPPYTVVMSEGSCDAFYKSILNSLKGKKGYALTPHAFFYKYLEKYRPDFIKRYEANNVK